MSAEFFQRIFLHILRISVEARNRFKGLDLKERVPDELRMEVCDLVEETGIKTIPKKNKCKRANWLSKEAL